MIILPFIKARLAGKTHVSMGEKRTPTLAIMSHEQWIFIEMSYQICQDIVPIKRDCSLIQITLPLQHTFLSYTILYHLLLYIYIIYIIICILLTMLTTGPNFHQQNPPFSRDIYKALAILPLTLLTGWMFTMHFTAGGTTLWWQGCGSTAFLEIATAPIPLFTGPGYGLGLEKDYFG